MINRHVFSTERCIKGQIYFATFGNEKVSVSFDDSILLIWLPEVIIASIELFKITKTINYTFEELKD